MMYLAFYDNPYGAHSVHCGHSVEAALNIHDHWGRFQSVSNSVIELIWKASCVGDILQKDRNWQIAWISWGLN